MLEIINRLLRCRSQVQVLSVGVFLVAIVGAVDYLTGREISFSIFYLLPILVVTWYGRRRLGYAICVLSSITWFIFDAASGEAYSHQLIPVWNAGVRLGFFLLTAYLLAKIKMHYLREQSLATIDDLSGLYNARAFKEFTSKSLNLTRRHPHPFVLAYIDLDNFKQLNDNLGHSEGDRALRMVGEVLRQCTRSSDIVGRLGGDEFAVAMPETDIAAAEVAFQKIRQELKIHAEQAHWPIDFSVGVAIFVDVPPGYDEAIRIADQLMYGVKSKGKGQLLLEEIATA